MRTALAGFAAAILLAGTGPASAQGAGAQDAAFGKTMGVVFMHGRGAPRPEDPDVISPLTSSMRSYGVTVVAPVMPWAGEKGIPNYTGTLDDGLKIVAAEVEKLRSKGLKKMFVGGMSEGGRAAIAYGGKVGDVDGIIAIAPSPDTEIRFSALDHPALKDFMARTPPERRGQMETLVRANLQKLHTARDMVAAGRGKERATFSEVNTSHTGVFEFRISVPAEIFLSHIDPDGLGNMRLSASKFREGLALFVALDDIALDRYASRRAFNAVPKSDRNTIVELNVSHLAAPRASRDAVRTWLQQFAQ